MKVCVCVGGGGFNKIVPHKPLLLGASAIRM